MKFDGEHLLPGQLGHFFVLLAFICSLLSTVAYVTASFKKDIAEKTSWIKFARIYFYVQTAAVLAVFGCIFILCSNHYIEYLYAYKHTSKELEFKYLLACIWEDQSGSFLLWSIWHCVLGIILIKKTKDPIAIGWEAPVMTVVSTAQVFLAMMIMGVYIGGKILKIEGIIDWSFEGFKIGNSPFVLTRNEDILDNAPMLHDNVTKLLKRDYLTSIRGLGLNVLLRNYWMVIHPPILFLGFASTVVPFAYAYAGLQSKRFGDWVKPALPYALFSACVLGVGIMMGGKWAYESLTFGGYWAWDPVENASLVPWLIMVAGLHTMVIYKATDHSLRASYLFVILSFLFILYSTFLTRTGILGDTSVHAFTEAGKAMNILILSFLLFFTLGSFTLFLINLKKIPAVAKEEQTNSREFWMFIGSLVLLLSSLFIIGKTSVPVINSVFGTRLAPSEDVEFSYNKVLVLVAVIIGILTAITQYFKYKSTPNNEVLKKIAVPTFIAAAITALLAIFYPIVYDKKGPGFLIALYVALFATIYAVVANAMYIKTVLKGNLKAAGASIAHLGFGLMIAGMVISAGNKKVISEENNKTFAVPAGIDPMTKQEDVAAENINLIRQLPARMGDYEVTYYGDSSGHESSKKFYHLLFQRKNTATKQTDESFVLNPDVYLMKNDNMSSNPDIKRYFTHDIFTYISHVLNPEKIQDTANFKFYEKKTGDTIFYSKGFMIYNGPNKNHHRIIPGNSQMSVAADITVVSKDSIRYHAEPVLMVSKEDSFLVRAGKDSIKLTPLDDTVYAQNLYLRFAMVDPGKGTVQIGVKESDRMIDFVTLKAYVFPYINLVWAGLVLMAVGIIMSMLNRLKISGATAVAIISVIFVALSYMFFIAAN
jgi:cytochrome c-type biogenesis protein CcmF